MLLREHLAALAKATDLQARAPDALRNLSEMRSFREALAADPELRTRASTMLLAMDERVALRDHITRWQMAVLKGALSGDDE